ncbi:hypothetical protein AK830_g3746 [Neonectria ditissima]|uniref:Uncharacterized protein n=1 Tax=Neonectria ditissima TaxID=78410 RepID=A0A0P7BPM3_9HYPO|nr:hypothetical protein AK830_g3746 [Neonectria ditissima]
MSQVDQQEHSAEDSENEAPQPKAPSTQPGGRNPKKNLQMQKATRDEEVSENESYSAPSRGSGRRIAPVRESRIKDRPAKVGEKDSSLKIKIELDLEVEVEIYARVKGDVTIGLM